MMIVMVMTDFVDDQAMMNTEQMILDGEEDDWRQGL